MAEKKRNKSSLSKIAKSWMAKAIIAFGVLVAIMTVLIIARPRIMYKLPYAGRLFAYADMVLRGPQVPGDGLYGIDISRHQDTIEWDKVDIRYDFATKRMNKKGDVVHKIHFAIAKASEGANYTDSTYEQNRMGIAKNGALFGAYHFFSFTHTPEAQAANYINKANLKKGDIAPVLDIEESNSLIRLLSEGSIDNKTIQEKAKAWLDAVEEAYGHKPIIYTSVSFKETYLDNAIFDEYPLWIAHYQVNEPKLDGDIWQFTENGRINGIKGNVDVDFFKGTAADFEKLLIK